MVFARQSENVHNTCVVRLLFSVLLVVLPPTLYAAEEVRCSLRAEPSRVVEGESVRLVWSSMGASQATLIGFGIVPTSGSRTVDSRGPRTYALSVKDRQGRTGHCTTAFSVTQRAPLCSISVTPSEVKAGSYATVTWNVLHAGSGRVSIPQFGTVPAAGSRTVTAIATTDYTVSAAGSGGSCVHNVRLTVRPAERSFGYFPTVAQSLFGPLFGSYPQPAPVYAPVRPRVVYEEVYTYDPYRDYVYYPRGSQEYVEYEVDCGFWCGWDHEWKEVEDPYRLPAPYEREPRWEPNWNEETSWFPNWNGPSDGEPWTPPGYEYPSQEVPTWQEAPTWVPEYQEPRVDWQYAEEAYYAEATYYSQSEYKASYYDPYIQEAEPQEYFVPQTEELHI